MNTEIPITQRTVSENANDYGREEQSIQEKEWSAWHFFLGGGGGGGQVTEGVCACLSRRKENHYCEKGNVTPN